MNLLLEVEASWTGLGCDPVRVTNNIWRLKAVRRVKAIGHLFHVVLIFFRFIINWKNICWSFIFFRNVEQLSLTNAFIVAKFFFNAHPIEVLPASVINNLFRFSILFGFRRLEKKFWL